MLGSKEKTLLGQPYLADASVKVIVAQQTLAPKGFIFNMKRRKNMKRMKGFRASVTSCRVVQINGM